MVIAIVENEVEKSHVLHLQNIRKDTLFEAKTAIDNFLDKFESLGDGDTIQKTVFQNFGAVCDVLEEFADEAMDEIEEMKRGLNEMEKDSLNYPKRVKDTTPGKFNPVCEMIAACNDFLNRAGSIMSKSYENDCERRPERVAEMWMADSYQFHQDLRKYLGEQSESRDLTFHWGTHVKKSSSEQGTYRVHF